jgi:hypothetical protein
MTLQRLRKNVPIDARGVLTASARLRKQTRATRTRVRALHIAAATQIQGYANNDEARASARPGWPEGDGS